MQHSSCNIQFSSSCNILHATFNIVLHATFFMQHSIFFFMRHSSCNTQHSSSCDILHATCNILLHATFFMQHSTFFFMRHSSCNIQYSSSCNILYATFFLVPRFKPSCRTNSDLFSRCSASESFHIRRRRLVDWETLILIFSASLQGKQRSCNLFIVSSNLKQMKPRILILINSMYVITHCIVFVLLSHFISVKP